MTDPINPSHYKQHPSGIEVIEIIRDLPCNEACAVKYILRAKYKGNEIQDLKKAVWYLKDRICQLQEQYDRDTQEVADFLTTHDREAMSRAADIDLEGGE